MREEGGGVVCGKGGGRGRGGALRDASGWASWYR
jgi:hypothetical protein